MEFTKKDRHNLLIGVLLTLFIASIMVLRFFPSTRSYIQPLENLEAKLYDYRMKMLRGPQKTPDNIVIAAIDEKSLEKLGRWPWDRDKIAALVDKMNEAGAEIIMFDAWFSEPEKNDPVLARSIKNAGNVILPLVFNFDKQSAAPEGELLENAAFKYVTDREMFDKYAPLRAKGVTMSLDEISREAMALGHINMNSDAEGTLRWETTAVMYKDRLYPSIDIQVASIYLGVPADAVVLGKEGIVLGKKRFLPTNLGGQSLINYYGDEHSFKYISLADIYEGTIQPGELQGKIILIGASAKGTFDLRVTPFSAEMPGVEKHANVIASILDDRPLRRWGASANASVLLISGLLFSLLLALGIRRFKIVGASVVTLVFLSLLSFSAYELFVSKGIWMDFLYPALNIFGGFVAVTSYNYAVEEKFARTVRAMFSSYVTERVVNELIRNPELAKLGGDRKEITLLFSDVRGFTTFSEKHAPEEVVTILNEYLAAMTTVVLKWEGTLDKFIGDAILAFWGAPMVQEDHAELAVRCALDMMRELGKLKEKWSSEGKTAFDIGIGINTGEVIVGNIGAEGKKMDYTIIGDHVNLGSRVESLTRQYDVQVIITEFTLERIRHAVEDGLIGHVAVRGLDNVIVKGKDKPVGIYELSSIEPGSGSCVVDCKTGNVIRMLKK